MVIGPTRRVHRVHSVRPLHPGTFVLRFDRHDLRFEPGQYVNLGPSGSIARREYSLYSGAADDYLEVLVKRIEGGIVSPALQRNAPGDALAVEGPYGLFVTDPDQRLSARYLFVATGTGIAPFHSLALSYPRMEYLLLHGVRTIEELHRDGGLQPQRCIACVSRGAGGDFQGRVTRYLREHPVDPGRLCYLCGNSGMIDDVFAILRDQGVPRQRISAEVYY